MSKNIGTLVHIATTFDQRAKESRLVDSWSEETATQFQTITTRFLSEVKALAGREETIRVNRDLSPSGKFNDTKVAVQAWFSALTWLKNLIGTCETRLGGFYGPLYVLPKSDRNETTQALRDWELREELRTLGFPERVKMFLQTAEVDDVERLRATLDAPGLTPLVPSEVRVRGLDLRASRLDPARYRAFIENGELLDALHTIAEECEDLAKEFGLDISKLALTADELGGKVREVLEFAIEHQHRGGMGKAAKRAEPARSPIESARQMVSA